MGTPFTVCARAAGAPARRRLRVRLRRAREARAEGRAGDADHHARAARGADPRPALRDAAQARRGQPGDREARGPRGPRPLLSGGEAPRRRGGAQAARAARARRRPARRVGDDLRPGRGRLLRPAHQADADRQAAPRPRTRCSTRSRISHELTHALEDQRFKLDLEDTSGSDDAALANLALVEGSRDRGDVHLRRAPLLRRADARRAVLLARAGHRRPAAVHRGAADLPLHPRASSSSSGSTRPAAGAGRWSTPPTASARPPRPSRSCTRTSTCRSSSPSGCRRAAAPRPGLARGSPPARGASGRPASCIDNPQAAEGWGGDRYELWQRGERRLPGAVPRPRRARHALALGHAAPTRERFEAALREWPGEQTGSRAISSRGREVALALAPEADLAQRLVE